MTGGQRVWETRPGRAGERKWGCLHETGKASRRHKTCFQISEIVCAKGTAFSLSSSKGQTTTNKWNAHDGRLWIKGEIGQWFELYDMEWAAALWTSGLLFSDTHGHQSFREVIPKLSKKLYQNSQKTILRLSWYYDISTITSIHCIYYWILKYLLYT